MFLRGFQFDLHCYQEKSVERKRCCVFELLHEGKNFSHSYHHISFLFFLFFLLYSLDIFPIIQRQMEQKDVSER